MESTLKSSRGCVYVAGAASGSSPGGWYELSPGLQGTSESPILLQGVDFTDTEVTLPVVTLDNKRILYSFGADFGQISIMGNVLLGPAEGGDGAALAKVVSWFKDNRVSTSKSTSSISLPGVKGYKFFATGLSIMVPDPEFHIQPFAIRGLLADPAPAK